ncbi:MAG TPA: DMT family transporter, partial [Chitinophagaceae bacterium]|nr:DMT family transporter [Chitinophagaceae bacterium]
TLSLTGFLITFLGAVLFSTKAIIVKKAFHDTHIDALSLLAIRMIFSLPFYLGIAIFTGNKKNNVHFTKQQWFWIITLGLFGYYISSFLDFAGLQYVSAGLERLILFLYPTFAVVINATVFKQKISRIQLLALLLTYTGIAIAYFGQLSVDTASHAFFLGSFLIFLCAITYAVYIVGSGKLIPQVGATKFTAYAMLASTCGVFIHYILAGNYQLLQSGTEYWGYGILLAILATVIPSFLISYGMKQIGSNNVAIVSGIGPVSTIIQAHFILGEKIFAEQIAGTLLVIAGVLLIGWKSRPLPE